ncbi:type II toxin-antitoxin system RelE/ParE family toxin [Enterococcus sp. AZ072]|uniref:type II toxin-antitoxin system RelE/ParE family toxin n=1 Tax=unclassified Enterococcus TaxID=2608891 RepID=UPI003D2CD604
MSYAVVLTNNLMSDLAKLSLYLEDEFSENSSKKVLSQLFDTFDTIGTFPKMGKDATALLFTFQGYMYLPLEKNILFYSIDENSETVTLLRLFSVSEEYIEKFEGFIY